MKEYMIVMQYANDGDLLSYLSQNINKLTWEMKLQLLKDIASTLLIMHSKQLVHCDLHGGNVILHNDDATKIYGRSFICDFSLSRSTMSESDSNIQGVLPFIAPEVFRTRKFTQKSDIYSFGIIMYLVATGEPPLRNRLFDKDLVCDILGGLRPTMPDSAPDGYKKLAEQCCDVDPNRRPKNGHEIWSKVYNLVKMIEKDKSDNNIWNTIYYNDIKPLSRLEQIF
jgi:serine/threonine protein kinase